MKTDYTNCHPKIAESLKKGEHIKCTALSYKKGCREIEAVVSAYYEGEEYPYGTRTSSLFFAEPLPKTETYVIDSVSIMKDRIINCIKALLRKLFKRVTETGRLE